MLTQSAFRLEDRWWVPRTTLAIVVAVAMASAAEAQTVPIAIVHARIIDGRGGPVIADASIVRRGRQIEALGAGTGRLHSLWRTTYRRAGLTPLEAITTANPECRSVG